MYIDGAKTAGETGQWLEATNPFDQSVWARFPEAGAADVEQAVAAARAAFDSDWRWRTGWERAQFLYRLADVIESDVDAMAQLESRDNGKIIRETTGQMKYAARLFRYFAGWADKIHGDVLPCDSATTIAHSLREPLGVVALITAWNSPMALLAYKLAPALAAGNTVVVKPSEHASVTTLVFADLVQRAGFPDGVVNVISGGARTGELLTRSTGLDKISFTGGSQTGRHVAACAAQTLTPVTLELGGKSPNIIFDDADLDRAVVGGLAGIFGASGQTCIAGSRLVVQRSVYDRVVEEIAARADAIELGNPLSVSTQMGPVANDIQFERIQSMIADAVAEGAQMAAGSRSVAEHTAAGGFFIAPTVFAGVDNGMQIAQREVFGPVLSIIPFEDEAEAISIANGTEYGLASAVWTRDINKAHRISRAIDAGTVWVNTYRVSGAQIPFGGTKNSGYGRERGYVGLLEYTRVKTVMIDLSDAARDPFLLQA